MPFKGESNSLVRFVIPLKLIFQQWTFPHQNLARNLKIIGPQSENNFPRKYDVTLNDVIVPALCAGSCLKNKVLVHFTHFYVPLLISNTIFWMHQLHWMKKFWNICQKVIFNVISRKWRVLEAFDDQAFHYLLSVSLNLI